MAEVIEPIKIVVGDRAKGISAVLGHRESDGSFTPLNLTNNTVVFRMVDGDGVAKINNQSANIDVAASGQVSYDWGATDTNTAGTFYANFIRTITASGKKEHFPGEGTPFKVIVIPAP